MHSWNGPKSKFQIIWSVYECTHLARMANIDCSLALGNELSQPDMLHTLFWLSYTLFWHPFVAFTFSFLTLHILLSDILHTLLQYNNNQAGSFQRADTYFTGPLTKFNGQQVIIFPSIWYMHACIQLYILRGTMVFWASVYPCVQ